MVAVKGIYQGDNIVKLNDSVPVYGPHEVVVAFLNPIPPEETPLDKQAKRQEGYQRFIQYMGILPSNFDYKKELSEYRDERYGHTN